MLEASLWSHAQRAPRLAAGLHKAAVVGLFLGLLIGFLCELVSVGVMILARWPARVLLPRGASEAALKARRVPARLQALLAS